MRLNSWWLFEIGAEIYGWFTAQRAWRDSCARLADHLPPGGDLTIVDLGCGPGVSTFELARVRPGATIAGLDIAGRMLAEARRRARNAGPASERISWLRADSARLPFKDGSVDALTGHSFLYLLFDQPSSLAEIARVLRPGGRVVLMEPSARPATPRGVLAQSRDPRYLVSVMLWRPFSRVHGRYTPRSLATALESVGLRVLGVEEVIGGLGLMAWAERP